MRRDKQKGDAQHRFRRWTTAGILLTIGLYEVLIVSLLYNELNASSYRATDRVLLLLGLLLLPLLGLMISGTRLINLKLPWNLEIMIENLEKQQQKAVERIDRQTQQLEREITGKLSTAEQTLYPIVGGRNEFARQRLEDGCIVIGSKDFAANIVAAELLALHLESSGLRCERWIPNGGTLTNYACLSNASLDLFVDYTGTGCLLLNVDHRNRTREETLETLNRLSRDRFASEWLKPLGTRSDYCLVVPRALSGGKNIHKISDLVNHRGCLRFCGNHEFLHRRDGLPGLCAFYGLRFAEITICSYRERYRNLVEGKADVTVGLSSDPEIVVSPLEILEDDLCFFPDYHDVPLVRVEAMEIVPSLRGSVIAFADLGIEDADIRALIQDYQDNPNSLPAEARSVLHRKKRLQPQPPSGKA